jgi:uncharacterized membrane protein YdcZ (DUF606 family)
MKIQDYQTKNVFVTFLIGFFAGIAPFAFTKVLPMMLHPEEFVLMKSLHVWIMTGGMLGSGIIVGIVIALMYAGTTETLTPKEVFLYALGIPAILITTVSNFTTDITARSEISVMQDTANAAISNSKVSQQDVPAATFKPVSSLSSGMKTGLLIQAAHAEDIARPIILAQNQQPYLVIIGTYTSRDEAKSAFDQFVVRKFRAETYVTKRLELLEQTGSPPQYVIVYARFGAEAEATRASRYLMINDRDLKVNLIRQAR